MSNYLFINSDNDSLKSACHHLTSIITFKSTRNSKAFRRDSKYCCFRSNDRMLITHCIHNTDQFYFTVAFSPSNRMLAKMCNSTSASGFNLHLQMRIQIHGNHITPAATTYLLAECKRRLLTTVISRTTRNVCMYVYTGLPEIHNSGFQRNMYIVVCINLRSCFNIKSSKGN